MLVENLVISYMLIDKQYLYYGRVTYQGVNHSGKISKKRHEGQRLVTDQIQKYCFESEWPEMTASREKAFRLGF